MYGISVYLQIETKGFAVSHGSQNLSKMMIGMVRDHPVSRQHSKHLFSFRY